MGDREGSFLSVLAPEFLMNRAVKQRRIAGVMGMVGDQFFNQEGWQGDAEIASQVSRISEARYAAVRKASLLEVELVRRSEELVNLRAELRACHSEMADLADSATRKISELNSQLVRAEVRCCRYSSALATLVDAVGRDKAASCVLGE